MSTRKFLYAYELQAEDIKGEIQPIPIEFLQHICNLPPLERWDAQFGLKSSPVTILKPKWLVSSMHRVPYLFGKFVELKYIEKVELIDLHENEETITIPDGQGEKSEFYFIFCPEKKIILIETNKRGCESKIDNFLDRHWERYKKNNPGLSLPILFMRTKATLIEDNARTFLNDKQAHNIQLAVECDKIPVESTLLPVIFELLGEQKEDLVLNISVSTSKRGEHIPKLAMSNFLDLMDNLEQAQALKNASFKEMINNKKINRVTKLVDIHLKKGVFIENEDDMATIFSDELDNLLDES